MRISILSLILALSIFLLAESPEEIDIYDVETGSYLKTDLKILVNQARKYYQEADYEEAAKAYLELLKFNITDAGNIYNLACCYGLLGEAELAAHYVQLSFKAGFDNLEHILNDPDFIKVQDDSVFATLIDSLKFLHEKDRTELPQYLKAESLTSYKINVPEDFKEESAYPLLIGLHGFGDNMDNFFRIGENSSRFFYAVPEAPYAFNLGNELGYSWTLMTDDPELITESWQESAELVLALITKIKTEYKISEIYLLGFSQGAHLSFLTGLKYPETIDAVAPFGGWLPDDILPFEEIKTASDLKVFVGHGYDDRMVEFSQAERAVELLRKYDFEVKTGFFAGGHTLDRDALQNAIDWMLGEKEDN